MMFTFLFILAGVVATLAALGISWFAIVATVVCVTVGLLAVAIIAMAVHDWMTWHKDHPSISGMI
jgi:hypothetical protein